MKKVKFIYFDIGGVMANTSDYFKGVTTKFKILLSEFMKFWEGDNNRENLTKGKITPQEFWNKAVKRFRLKDAENFDFLESWMSDYKPILEVHSLAKALSRNFKIGLLSNLYSGMMPRLVEKGKVADINYSSIVLSCDVGLRKPEKEIFELATIKAGVSENEIFFIDDKEDFIEGAKDYGWQTFLFDGKNTKKSINLLKNIIFRN